MAGANKSAKAGPEPDPPAKYQLLLLHAHVTRAAGLQGELAPTSGAELALAAWEL